MPKPTSTNEPIVGRETIARRFREIEDGSIFRRTKSAATMRDLKPARCSDDPAGRSSVVSALWAMVSVCIVIGFASLLIAAVVAIQTNVMNGIIIVAMGASSVLAAVVYAALAEGLTLLRRIADRQSDN